jgi:hypothetical protein
MYGRGKNNLHFNNKPQMPRLEILQSFQEFIENHLGILLQDSSYSVKNATISKVENLCSFFGKKKSFKVILVEVLNLLGHPDKGIKWYILNLVHH